MAKFKIRGGPFWRIAFWWDYKVCLSLPMIKLTFWYWRIRYKMIFDEKTHKVWKKDRLRPWKKKEDTGAMWI